VRAARCLPLCVLGLIVAAAGACRAPSPRVALGPAAAELDALLAAHPLAPDQGVRADEIGRTAGSSYHLVQVRGSERPHRHATHDLTVLVLRGRGVLTRGGVGVALGAGDAAAIPRGEPHWFANDGPGSAVALVVFTPPLDAPDVVPADDR
jgi:quercetin dioxygenase-like cupin family protein